MSKNKSEARCPACVAASLKTCPPGDTMMLSVRGVERTVHVPSGFWEMDREELKHFIAQTWPGVTWASNGRAGIWTINLNFSHPDVA